MDTAKNTAAPTVNASPKSGVYVRGHVISNRVNAFRRKDGSGMLIKVQHEIALQPGVAIWERYFDPRSDREVKFDGEKVTEFPQLPEFQPISLRAERFKADGEKLIVTMGILIS